MRYQLQSEHGQFSWKPRYFTDAIKILIGVNILLFVFRTIAQEQIDLTGVLGLSPQTVWPQVWGPVTYLFIHGGIWHVAINMLVLWMFGSELEMTWGKNEFLKYYFVTGVGSGLVWLLLNISSNHDTVLIGASGAVYGILMAYGLMFPNRTVYLYFIIPVKVKWFVIFIGAIAFFSSMNAGSSNISHLTHLSGMVIGYIYLKSNQRGRKLSFTIRKSMAELGLWFEVKKQEKRGKMQRRVDHILDRVNEVGYENLSEDEKNILYTASKEFSKNRPKD